jgi:hypothetical protein
MPNPGYANFTIKSQAARKLKELSQRNGVSLPALINMMGERLDPNVKLDALLRALEFAPSLNFSQFLEREALKLRCASLYCRFKALTSIAISLLQPSAAVDLRVMTDVRALEKKKDQLSAFQAASLIDPSISLADVVALIRKLERGAKALEMLLDEKWRGWRSDFKEPLLPNEIRISNALLPGGAPPENLREELRPCVEAVSGLWMETKNLLQSISNAPEISSTPNIIETLMGGLEEFSGLFLNFEAVSAQR